MWRATVHTGAALAASTAPRWLTSWRVSVTPTQAQLRIRDETGARTWLLLLANLTTVVVLVAFAVTTLVEEPGTAVALVAILMLGIVLDLVWKRRRTSAPVTVDDVSPKDADQS